jgi:protein SCO1/2
MRKRFVIIIAMWAVTAIAAVGLCGMIWVAHSRQTIASVPVDLNDPLPETAGPLPILFDAPKFDLIDQNAKPFSSDQMHGKIWVADFIFTQCNSLCPLMTQNMADFQKKTARSDVQMLSFSVDPETDRPPVLKDYAAKNGADESRWHFLTGTRAQTWAVSEGMKLAVGPDDGKQVFHSSHFLLIDANGHVRGIYDSNDAGFMNKLVSDATHLHASN